MASEQHETVAGLAARMITQMAERTEVACARVMAALGEGYRERACLVRQDGTTAFGASRRIEVDGLCVWRLWWDETGEYAWALHDEWSREPDGTPLREVTP
jgi:hypothetical protein